MPRIMPWKSVSTARRSRSESDEQPKASMTHSTPLMLASPLSLRLPAFGAEFAGARNGLAALTAEFRGCGSRCARRRRSRATAARSTRSGLFHGVHHRLTHRDTRAKSCAYADCSAAFIPSSNWNCLRHLILRELAHVSEDVHADALVENLLQLVGERKIFDDESIESQAIVGERGLELLVDFFGKRALVGGHIEKRNLAARKGVGHFGDD